MNELIEKDKEPFIFISYSHKDSDIVLQVIKELKNSSYRIWYDDGIDPGTEWDKNIAEHVEKCGYFIAFISNNYINSSNCKDELNFARDLEKKRFLVYIEEVDLPSEMKMRLSRIQNVHKYKYDNDIDFYNKLFSAEGLSEFKDKTEEFSKKSKSLIESYNGSVVLDNRYELRNIIGEGGFGVTYRAKDLKNNTIVAVKVGNYKSDLIIRLHKHLMNIENDNLCKVYTVSDNATSELYIVSELLNDSKSLFDVKDYRELYANVDYNYPLGAHFFVLIDILKGLKCLHDNNIVHADINPSNIMTNGYTTKVIDYSSAFFIDEGPTNDSEHTVIIGGYNSPEEKKDFRSDIYSVGMVGFKWLTGDIPKEDKDGRLVFDNMDLDETILRVLIKATAFNPEDRYQTVEEFINEIEKCFFAFKDQAVRVYTNVGEEGDINSDNKELRKKNKTIDGIQKTETDSIIKSESKQIIASLNKSQRKELMSCKCFYCGLYAEVLADTDGYYAECVHCGAVGTIADTIDEAIANWKLCMTGDNEYSGLKLCKDDVPFIESKASKISAYFDDTINSIDSILDEIQSVLDSNDDDMTDSECLLEKTELKQYDRGYIGYLALSLDDVLITKNCKQHFNNPITLRMPNNESLEFEFVEESALDEKYIIVSRRKSKDCFVFSIFKNPEGTANPPTAIFEGKKLKKIYRAFMENHKNEYEFTDEIVMQPNIQPRKSEQPRGFTEKTASGMFGPYLGDVIDIPSKYTFVDSHVFSYTNTSYSPKKISKLIIPASVTKIEAFAFSDIIVDEIIVPDSVTEIGCQAFNLTSDGFIECTPDSYAYKYAKYNDLKNSVDIENDYKIKGLCSYCGGKFSGLFKKKCSICGKEKDY